MYPPIPRTIACALALLLTACPQFAEDDNNANNAPSKNNVSNNVTNNTTPMIRPCTTRVLFNGGESASKVTMSGEFNGWDKDATPLVRKDGAWVAELDLEPGQYAYKYVVDDAYEESVPPDVYTKWDGGFENRALIVPDCAIPRWEVVRKEVDAQGKITAVLQFQSAASGARIDPATLEVSVGRQAVQPQVDAATGRVTVTYEAPKPGKYTIRATAKDTAGEQTEQAPLWLPLWVESGEPFVWQDATMYLVFTDRFLDTDNGSPVTPITGTAPIAGYMGGDFRGVKEKIESGYFDELGVNLLWLSPIYENSEKAWIGGDGVNSFTGYHGYWPIDPLKSETRYGDAEADSDTRLKEVIDAAHARGIRVLFDVVHNHVHEDHVYCKENPSWCAKTCTCGGPGCGWDDVPLTCQFAPYLPDLSYRNHDILTRQVSDTLKLAEKFDVDGLRVDAAKHMDHIIMRTLRMRMNELEEQGAAPFYTVGETYTFTDGHGLIMQYVADYELHGQFDFPLMYPIRDVFGHGGSFRALEAAVGTSERVYGDAYKWMSPFLGNHDIPRFVTESLGNDNDPWSSSLDVMAQGPADSIVDAQWNIINRLSMAFAFLLTQPGVPLIYYGDEIGLAGSADPDNRRMMKWDWNAGQRELLGRVRGIGKARQALAPLRRGDRKELWVDDSLYVYARYTGPGQAVIIAMNKGEGTRTEVVTIPSELGLLNKRFKSVNSTRELTVNGAGASVTLDAWEYAIFEIQP
jgi:neopullulanase